MGTFFKALEQAERERALKEQAGRRAATGDDPAPSAAAVVPAEEPAIRPVPETIAAEAPALRPVPEAIVAESVFQRPKERPPLPTRTPDRPASGFPQVESHLVSLLAPTSSGAEQYRTLRLKVEQLRKTANLSIVGVTSPRAGDGKTLTTINLAGALAQAPDARVLIVDADLRRSSMTRRLGLEGSPSRGLVGAILDPSLSLKDAVDFCPPFNLSVLRAGRRPSAPYELLKSPRLGQLLDEARQQYDYVILDMPPLVPLPDCGVIGRWVNGFLVVVAANKTPRKFVEEALKVLDPPTVIGLVFNGADQPVAGYYSDSSERERTWWGGDRRRNAEDGAE
jgi:capsular exopolysaccharide synthesis family protein